MSVVVLPARTDSEIGGRLIATFLCGAVACKPSLRDEIVAWIAQQDLAGLFSTEEAAFLENPEPSDHTITQFTWYVEVTAILAWAGGLVEQMPDAASQSSLGELVNHFPMLGDPVHEFIDSIRARPSKDLHVARQRVEDLHGCARADRCHGRAVRHGTDIDVVSEQHRVLNWLTYAEYVDWDQVTTDT